MTSYSNVAEFALQFEHAGLHAAFHDMLPTDELIDSSQRLAPTAFDKLRELIHEVMIQDALPGSDPAHLTSLIGQTILSADIDGGSQGRKLRSNKQLKMVFDEAIRLQKTSFTLRVDTSQWYFVPGLQVQDTDCITLSRNQPRAVPAVANAGTAAAVYASTTCLPSTATNGHASSFHVDQLPQEVQDRFRDFDANQTIVPADSLAPFKVNGQDCNFYEDSVLMGPRCILRSGGLLQPNIDAKRFERGAPKCGTSADGTNVTDADLRTWYEAFHRHALVCGVFTMPYALMDPNHPGEGMGFEYGIDVPNTFLRIHTESSQVIHQALRANGTFPSGSEEANIASSYANGYCALYTLMTRSHPRFVESPSKYLADLPKQTSKESLYEYHRRFKDIVWLRGVFAPTCLDESQLIDAFINGALQGHYFLERYRLDKLDPTKAPRLGLNQIHITLAEYSKSNKMSPQPPPTTFVPRNPYCKPFTPQIHEIGVEDNASGEGGLDFATMSDADVDTCVAAFVHQVHREMPKGNGQIRDCVICGGSHGAECPAAKHPRFLTKCVVQLGLLASRMKREAQGLIAGQTGLPATIRSKAELHVRELAAMSGSAAATDHDQDFHQGPVGV